MKTVTIDHAIGGFHRASRDWALHPSEANQEQLERAALGVLAVSGNGRMIARAVALAFLDADNVFAFSPETGAEFCDWFLRHQESFAQEFDMP